MRFLFSVINGCNNCSSIAKSFKGATDGTVLAIDSIFRDCIALRNRFARLIEAEDDEYMLMITHFDKTSRSVYGDGSEDNVLEVAAVAVRINVVCCLRMRRVDEAQALI